MIAAPHPAVLPPSVGDRVLLVNLGEACCACPVTHHVSRLDINIIDQFQEVIKVEA